MVTCFTCRKQIDDGGHAAQCPILIEELRAYRLAAAGRAQWLSKSE